MDDPLWGSHFTGLFTPQAFPVPFYPVRGNHDYRSLNPDAQLEYYTKHGEEGRWIFPAAYYQIKKVLADGTTIDLVFLDTILLAPEATESETVIHLHDQEKRKEKQYAWLEATLAESTADWLLVFGHHPVFSAGEHGDTPSLVTRLLPVLEKHHVDMYVSGHDHTLQHLQHQPKTHTQFFVNGNGAKMGLVRNVTQAAHVRKAEVKLGFMSHQLTRKSMTTKAIDREGGVVFEYTQLPRRRAALIAELEEGRGMNEGEDEEGLLNGSVSTPVLALPQEQILEEGEGALVTREEIEAQSSSAPALRGVKSKRYYLSSSSSTSSAGDIKQHHAYLRGQTTPLMMLLMSLVGMALVMLTILFKRRLPSSTGPSPPPYDHSFCWAGSSYLQSFVSLTEKQEEEEMEREEGREEGKEGRSFTQLLEHPCQARDSDMEDEEGGEQQLS